MLAHYRLLVEDEFVSVTVGLSQLIVLGKAKFLHFVFLGADTVSGFSGNPGLRTRSSLRFGADQVAESVQRAANGLLPQIIE